MAARTLSSCGSRQQSARQSCLRTCTTRWELGRPTAMTSHLCAAAAAHANTYLVLRPISKRVGTLPLSSMLMHPLPCPAAGGPLELANKTYARLLRKYELDVPLAFSNVIDCPEVTLGPTWQLPGLYVDSRSRPLSGGPVSDRAAGCNHSGRCTASHILCRCCAVHAACPVQLHLGICCMSTPLAAL
jgi:hypothetical protein